MTDSTYRERRLAKAERLRGWADGREAKSDAAREASRAATAGIPLGQPVLVGHHSQRRHERALERGMSKLGEAVEHARRADEMRSRADAIERQASRAIYSDDADAIERLREKIARLEAEREVRKQANADYRKAHRAALKSMSAYERAQAVPFPAYSLSNLGGQITQARDRLARLERGPADRRILARFDGECADCGRALTKGEIIRYNRQQGARCGTGCES